MTSVKIGEPSKKKKEKKKEKEKDEDWWTEPWTPEPPN